MLSIKENRVEKIKIKDLKQLKKEGHEVRYDPITRRFVYYTLKGEMTELPYGPGELLVKVDYTEPSINKSVVDNYPELFLDSSKITEKKLNYLKGIWDGWKYIWIKGDLGEICLHEVHQLTHCDEDEKTIYSDGIAWTEKEVTPMARPEVLKTLATLLEDDIVFTEEELKKFNRGEYDSKTDMGNP